MLGLGSATRIYVATRATDMRLGFNGLYALVVGQLQQNPRSGHLFLFANKRRDRMKILFFDSNSLWVCARRMEQGRLHWPTSEEGRVPDATESNNTTDKQRRSRQLHPGRN